MGSASTSKREVLPGCVILATEVAGLTRRVQIGTFVADPYLHHSALTAVTVGTLDEISHI